MSAKIWVTGAGKGGVGKTFIASSVGVTLARMKHKVLLVDLDHSGANIHTAIGEGAKSPGLEHYWFKSSPIESLIYPSQVHNMFYIRGASNQWVSWQPTPGDALSLLSDLKALPFDFIILDLGPGANSFQIELFRAADERLIITSPEPTSIEKTYRLWETMLGNNWSDLSPERAHQIILECMGKYRNSLSICEKSFREFIEQNMEQKSLNEKGLNPQSQDNVIQMRPSAESKNVKDLNFRLILNGSRSLQDHNLGFSIMSVSKKHFNINVDYVGSVDYDNAVWQSMRTFQLLLHEKPYIQLTGQILGLCKQILNSNFDASQMRAVI